jgi:branched-chain amino acid transport system ATP-binding protein
LSVTAGEIAGLIGPNGAGKTTLFNLLAGNLRPTAGEIRIDGRSVAGSPAHRRLGLGLGRTFQIPRPFANLTVLENLLLAAPGQVGERVLANWFMPGRVARQEKGNLEKALALLEFVDLARLARDPAHMLSGGQRTIMARIEEINRRGIALLIVEHNMDLIARLCRTVFVMAGGRLLCAGTPQQVAEDPRVIEAYLGGAPR